MCLASILISVVWLVDMHLLLFDLTCCKHCGWLTGTNICQYKRCGWSTGTNICHVSMLPLARIYQAEVMRVLNNIRNDAGKLCLSELPRYNSPMIMAQCGSKGRCIFMFLMGYCVDFLVSHWASCGVSCFTLEIMCIFIVLIGLCGLPCFSLA